MRRIRTPTGLTTVAITLGLFSLIAIGAILWGPLHETYERVCLLYPPLRGVGPLPFTLFVTLALASATLGLGSLVAGTIRSVRLSNKIQASRVETPATLRQVMSGLHMEERVICIEGRQPLAFCYGLFRPMVCISRSVIDCLEPKELRAVLAHEREPLTTRDPLRILLGRAFARALFIVPSVNELYRRYVLRRELRADDECIASCDFEPLASALLKLGTADLWNPTGVPGFSLIEERIRHLIEPDNTRSFGIPWAKSMGQAMLLMGFALLGFSVLRWTTEAAVVGCLL